MKYCNYIQMSAVAVSIASFAMPVLADLTVLEKTPEMPQQKVVEEDSRTEIDRLNREIDRLKAEIYASKGSGRHCSEKLGKINQTLDKIEQKMVDVGAALLRVHFGHGRAKFIPTTEVGEAMVSAGMMAKRINIRGHSDNTGFVEANRVLAMTRAVSVKRYMAERGVSKSKIYVFSRGAGEPIGDNLTKEGRAKNRRVDIEFNY